MQLSLTQIEQTFVDWNFKDVFASNVIPVMKLLRRLLLTIAAVSILASCKTVSVPDPTPLSDVTLHIHARVNGQPFDTNTVFAINGRNVRFTNVLLYISSINLIQQNGTAFAIKSKPLSVKSAVNPNVNVTFDDKVVLFRYEQFKDDEVLDSVSVGKYQSIRFVLGVSDPANQVNATEMARLFPTHPLAQLTDIPNWWSWGSYIFTCIQGKIDTSAAGTGTPTSPTFYYQVGGEVDMTSTITITAPFEVTSTGENTVHAYVDIAKFFTGIDLKKNPNCIAIRSTEDGIIGKKFRDNQRAQGVFVAE
jgi:hypothetical protein